MTDEYQIEELLAYYMDESVPMEEKYNRFFSLDKDKKQGLLTHMPKEIKSEFIRRKKSENDEKKKAQAVSAPVQTTLAPTTVNSAKGTAMPNRLAIARNNRKIRLIKNRIRKKRKTFLELYYSCIDVGRYWSWMNDSVTHSYNALEMNMKLKRSISEEDKKRIHDVYHQESAASGVVFEKTLEVAMLEPNKPITEEFIKSLHRDLLPTEPEHAGEYRRIKARFPNTQTVLPNYEKIPQLMAEMIERNNQIKDPIERAFKFHFDMVAIHPFTDGNGRISRFIMNTILMQNDYPPVIIEPYERAEYIKALETYSNKGDDVPYRIFMLKQLEQSIGDSTNRLRFLPHYMTKTEEEKINKSRLINAYRALKGREG